MSLHKKIRQTCIISVLNCWTFNLMSHARWVLLACLFLFRLCQVKVHSAGSTYQLFILLSLNIVFTLLRKGCFLKLRSACLSVCLLMFVSGGGVVCVCWCLWLWSIAPLLFAVKHVLSWDWKRRGASHCVCCVCVCVSELIDVTDAHSFPSCLRAQRE